MQSSTNDDRNSILKHTVDEVLISLGPSIQETIMWHMNNRGIFLEHNLFSIDLLYENLGELMGPYAEEILDLTWERLQKKFGVQQQSKSLKTIEKIKSWLSAEGGAK